MMTTDDDLELKKEFGRELLKLPRDPFKVALAVIGGDTAKALYVAKEWPLDIIVLEEQARIRDEKGDKAGLPSKEEFARKIMDAADNLSDAFFEEKLKAYRLFGDVMGYIERPQVTQNINPVTHNRVMIVKEHGSNSDWEQRLLKQQADLVANNGETRH